MSAVLQGLSGIFEIIVIVLTGVLLQRHGYFWKTAGGDLTKFVMKIALPPFMIDQLYRSFTREKLMTMGPELAAPFLSIFISFVLAYIWAALFRVRPGRRGVFITTCAIANCIFIGLPVNMALFGSDSVPYAMLYYIANTVMFWTIGAYFIIKDAGADHAMTAGEILKKMMTPPLLAFVLGVVLVYIECPIPGFLLTSMHYVGNIATPMALIVIGIEVGKISFSDLVIDKDLIGAMLGRFFLGPVGLILLIPFFPVDPLAAKVFLLQSAMPAMTNMSILAYSVGADAKYSTMVNCVSLLLGIFFVPFYMWVSDFAF